MSNASPTDKPAGGRGSGEVQKATAGALVTEQGKTTIADTVVEKIAGLAAREVRGVHKLGSGLARTFGAVRDIVPGSRLNAAQGVAVEVGERQAAVDLVVVIEYGAAIGELSRAIRTNVIEAIESMTALQVTEVNISISDVHLPGDDQDDAAGQDPRVQ